MMVAGIRDILSVGNSYKDSLTISHTVMGIYLPIK